MHHISLEAQGSGTFTDDGLEESEAADVFLTEQASCTSELTEIVAACIKTYAS